ncbi:Maf family nucleotide pyrophosphatase [Methylophilus aquaticus]|uniref:7-methyl-GTP pyrophosphatase n=1 Tax=Methylophilus aquaticus TaxID=1971610 RepID=A0ABT9JRA1_9PROT|nr:Maf family nucleotide pyrophosphatase [Methylophilus aquaticus]MDP8567079.1 Maf family nucleotide pyrophosphatase [Methylophilus aquaticus]
MPTPLILASSSRYRREVLQKLHLPFESLSPEIDETPLQGESPEQTALRLAEAKARKVAEHHPGALIIGCDQVATVDGQQIGKPGNHTNAVRQLSMLSGREVIFHSALCLYNSGNQHMQSTLVPYHVKFKTLTPDQIEHYLQLEQPYDCVGSAKSEGMGIALLDYMRGDDPNALIGLPLIALVNMLQNAGVDVLSPHKER